MKLFVYAPENPHRDQVLAVLLNYVEALGEECHILVQPPKKSREQEQKYHAMLQDIARDCRLYGRDLPADSWKRLCIDAFKHATNTPEFPRLMGYWGRFGVPDLLPALNNPGFVSLGEQSREFPQYVAGAFIEWLQAFGDCPDKPASCVTPDGRVRWTEAEKVTYLGIY